MRVVDVDVTETARGTRTSAVLVWADQARGRDDVHFLYRDTPADAVATPGDAWLAVALVPAIALGEDVSIEAPVSRKLLNAAPAIADFLVSWVPSWRRSSVDAQAVDRSDLSPTEVAAGFSGGVDSYYTTLRERNDPITLLVTTLGLHPDHVVDDLEPLIGRLSRTAETFGRRHLVVESNALRVLRAYIGWTPMRGMPQWGSLVAAQALGLGALIRRFHIAASWHELPVPPSGTHPDLDPMWSTEAVSIEHDTLVERSEKVKAIARCKPALDALYVCFRHPTGVGNCGVCTKCVGTALMLRNAGVLDRCATMPPLDAGLVRRLFVHRPWVPDFERLRAETAEPEIRRAISHALRRSAVLRRLAPLIAARREFSSGRARRRTGGRTA